jgi:hypothetical protein
MKQHDKTLSEQYRDFVDRRTDEARLSCLAFDRKNRRHISTLACRNISTTSQLIAALPELPANLKDFALWWFMVTRERRAETTLLAMLKSDNDRRLMCAAALSSIGGSRSRREFVRIGQRELAAANPDRHLLDVVIQGLKMCIGETAEIDELLLTIYERVDLPGWLRGDAGDALGCCSRIMDRRTTDFRRAWTTARNGLFDNDIEVKFWSMYVVMQLANTFDSRRSNAIFADALPQLRKIAKTDHRLAPGFWWPMSAEAEDAMYVIKHGQGRDNDAGMRWLGNTERGPMIRD